MNVCIVDRDFTNYKLLPRDDKYCGEPEALTSLEKSVDMIQRSSYPIGIYMESERDLSEMIKCEKCLTSWLLSEMVNLEAPKS